MKKLYFVFCILILILAYLFFNKINNELNDITITTEKEAINYFTIDKKTITRDYIKSEEFQELITENIKLNFNIDMEYEENIKINQQILSLNYILFNWYLEDNSIEYYSLNGKFSLNEEPYDTNDYGTEFVNLTSIESSLSSHSSIFKVYFAETENHYIVFSTKER